MKSTVTLLFIVVLMTGCATTPTGDIGAFGDATKDITDKIDAVIKDYNEANIQNEINKLAQHTSSISIDKFDPIRDAIIHEADKKNYAIYKANNALGLYAKSLTALANAGNRDEIDLAAAKLYGSLHGLNEQYKVLKNTTSNLLDDNTSALIGKAIAEIGSVYIENQRAKAIKSIVVAADKHIQTICDVIVNELLKGVIEERLFTIRHIEVSGYLDDYNKMVATATFIDKQKALGEIYKKYVVMQSSSASVVQAINAIEAIKKAHATIKKDVEEDKFTSKGAVEAIGNLKDINDHYNNLEEMMLSCKTQIIADPKKGVVCEDKKN